MKLHDPLTNGGDMISKKAMVKGTIGAVALSAGVFSIQDCAGVAYGYDIEYYSDASMTEMVGETVMGCDNRVINTGVKTPYYREIGSWPCPTAFPPPPWWW
jgi:hypothetical protein